MKKAVIRILATIVFGICVYSFLLGNGVFKGKFDNDPIGWYFLAKGIFCSVSLFLSVDILEAIKKLRQG